MGMLLRTLILGLIILAPLSASADDVCAMLNDAVIIAQDDANTYLGKIDSSYDPDSIFNEYGVHGSQYSASSIWNEYSTFGSEYSTYSPFNEYTSTPPMIIKNRQIIAYLTTNKYLQGAISPNMLKALCGS